MSLSFSEFAKAKIKEALKMFGEYPYYDKGPHEVMDIDELVREAEKLPIEELISELNLLAAYEHGEPAVNAILHSVDEDQKFEKLFEDDDLSEMY